MENRNVQPADHLLPIAYMCGEGHEWLDWKTGSFSASVLTFGILKIQAPTRIVNGIIVYAFKFQNGAVWNFKTGWQCAQQQEHDQDCKLTVNNCTTATSITATLQNRQNRYGDFDDHARITQDIKRAMVHTNNWERLTPAMKESLEMIAHKIGRILNGDPNYKDSWHDIVGYAKLIDDNLED
jgi:hypothetical protein